MENIDFYKMSGSGNDFIIIDNRKRIVDEAGMMNFVANVCRRKMSVGADGLILIEDADAVDFKWRFFNSDGSVAEMCGNGARCAARFAYIKGIAGTEMSFETEAGIIHAKVARDQVKIKMPDPADLKTDYALELENSTLSVSSVNTGVPHVVVEADNIDDIEVVKLGREIRFHDVFDPAGTNVNFVCLQNDDIVAIRTYERGVEDETLACGTGAIACAIVISYKKKIKSPVKVMTRSGGYLYIYYKVKQGRFYDIFLEGDARIIYKAQLWEDAWKRSEGK
jgi:diaminopimelate epimerase